MNPALLRVVRLGDAPLPPVQGMAVEDAPDPGRALALAGGGGADLILVDWAARKRFGPWLVAKLAEGAGDAAVVVRADQASGKQAMEALEMGAADLVIEGDPAEDMEEILRLAAAAHRRRRFLAGQAERRSSQIGDWYWETDADFRFSWVSRGFRDLMGVEAENIIGLPPWEIDIHGQPPEDWLRLRQDMEKNRPLKGALCSFRDAKGGLHAFRINGLPAPVGYAGVGHDATREVEHSDRLARAHEHLMDSHEELRAFHSRVDEDLKAARNMQKELLPKPETVRAVEERYGVSLESHFATSSEVGGDIWGLHAIDDQRFAIYLADFTGHGVTAALNTFRLHAVIDHMIHGRENPGGYIQAVNRRLAGLLPTGQYATLFYGVVDVAASCIRYAAAAAPPPLVVEGTEGKVVAGDGSGLPLGITAAASFETRELAFPEGGTLFLYSDALLECGRQTGLDLGKQGVVDLLGEGVRRNGADATLPSLLGPFFARVPPPYDDDLTVIRCFRRV